MKTACKLFQSWKCMLGNFEIQRNKAMRNKKPTLAHSFFFFLNCQLWSFIIKIDVAYFEKLWGSFPVLTYLYTGTRIHMCAHGVPVHVTFYMIISSTRSSVILKLLELLPAHSDPENSLKLKTNGVDIFS